MHHCRSAAQRCGRPIFSKNSRPSAWNYISLWKADATWAGSCIASLPRRSARGAWPTASNCRRRACWPASWACRARRCRTCMTGWAMSSCCWAGSASAVSCRRRTPRPGPARPARCWPAQGAWRAGRPRRARWCRDRAASLPVMPLSVGAPPLPCFRTTNGAAACSTRCARIARNGATMARSKDCPSCARRSPATPRSAAASGARRSRSWSRMARSRHWRCWRKPCWNRATRWRWKSPAIRWRASCLPAWACTWSASRWTRTAWWWSRYPIVQN